MPNRATGLDWGRVIEGTAPTGGTRGGRAASLSTPAIVDAAMSIADRDGMDAVSIRRVASLLGVRPMSLYTHIASKDELLDLMANELVGMMLLDSQPTGGWRTQLRAITRQVHATFVAHPWALSAFARRPRTGPNALLYAKQQAQAIAELELSPKDMWTMLGIVNDFVLGHALRVGTRAAARDLDASLTQSDLADLPELAAIAEVEDARASQDSFETGLQAVLDGVAIRFASASGSAAADSLQSA